MCIHKANVHTKNHKVLTDVVGTIGQLPFGDIFTQRAHARQDNRFVCHSVCRHEFRDFAELLVVLYCVGAFCVLGG